MIFYVTHTYLLINPEPTRFQGRMSRVMAIHQLLSIPDISSIKYGLKAPECIIAGRQTHTSLGKIRKKNCRFKSINCGLRLFYDLGRYQFMRDVGMIYFQVLDVNALNFFRTSGQSIRDVQERSKSRLFVQQHCLYVWKQPQSHV